MPLVALCLVLCLLVFFLFCFIVYFCEVKYLLTTVLLIIGRQLAELCVFLVTCHHMICACNLT